MNIFCVVLSSHSLEPSVTDFYGFADSGIHFWGVEKLASNGMQLFFSVFRWQEGFGRARSGVGAGRRGQHVHALPPVAGSFFFRFCSEFLFGFGFDSAERFRFEKRNSVTPATPFPFRVVWLLFFPL